MAASQLFYFVNIGLCLFFFVSGYVLYHTQKNFLSIKDVIRFYHRRAKRIYPLYWFAFIIIVIIDWEIANGLFIGFLGLQGFYPVTIFFNNTILWFIGVLLIYYIIYPVLVRPRSLMKMFSVASIMYLILTLIFLNFNVINVYFFPYYWVFFAGIAMSWFNDNFKNLNFDYKELFLKSIILVFLLTLVLKASLSTPFYDPSLPTFNFTTFMQIMYILGTLLIFSVVFIFVTRISKDFFQSKTYELITKVSAGSYATYLLHVSFGRVLIKIGSILGLPLIYINLALFFIGLPLVFLIGYYAQKWELDVMYLISRTYKKYIKRHTDKD